jgi:type III secretion protein L
VTAVLKSGSAAVGAKVRAFGALPAAPARDPEIVRLAEANEALALALAARDETVAALEAKAETAYAAGEADGREAGRAEADDRESERRARIEEAAAAALAAVAAALDNTERQAALLARACLDRLFLAPENRATLVCDLIRRQVEALRGQAAVRIEVSAEDFADADALAAVAAGCEIAASPALASGDCTIDLALGAIDIGLDQQWGALRAALDGAIGEDGR